MALGVHSNFSGTNLLNWQRTGDFSLHERGRAAMREYPRFLFTSAVTSDVPYVSLWIYKSLRNRYLFLPERKM